MPYRFDLHVRLEAIHTRARPAAPCAPRCARRCTIRCGSSAGSGSSASIAARDAASPALVHLTVTETPITGRSRRARGRPADHAARGDHRVRAGAVVDDRAARPRRAGAADRGPRGAAQRPGAAARRRLGAPYDAAQRPGARRPGAVPRARLARSGRRAVRRPGRAGRRAGRRLAAGGAGLLGDVRGRAGDADDPAPRRRRRGLVLGHGRQRGPTRRSPRRRSCARAIRPASPTTARRIRAGGRSRTIATTRARSPRTARSWRR